MFGAFSQLPGRVMAIGGIVGANIFSNSETA
jgi:hypothetical protein